MKVGPARRMKLAPLGRAGVCLAAWLWCGNAGFAQQPAAPAQGSTEQQTREAGPPRRIPRQQALTTAALDGTVREQTTDSAARPVVGARIQVRHLTTGVVATATTSGDGVFRMLLLLPGAYEFHAEAD